MTPIFSMVIYICVKIVNAIMCSVVLFILTVRFSLVHSNMVLPPKELNTEKDFWTAPFDPRFPNQNQTR